MKMSKMFWSRNKLKAVTHKCLRLPLTPVSSLLQSHSYQISYLYVVTNIFN